MALTDGVNVQANFNMNFNPGNSEERIKRIGNAADKTAQLINRISNSSVQFSKIVGQAAHSAQQSFLQVDNRLRNLQRGMETASSSAFALSQRLNALSKGLMAGPALSQFSNLNGRLRDVTASARQGTSAMNDLQNVAVRAGASGAKSMATLSANTISAIAGLATLTKFLYSASQQMERMDILRASYQRIMSARPDMTSVEAMNKTMKSFWENSKSMAYQYGAAIDDVAGTMIEFARQGHSPDTVQYLTGELAKLRLMLATSTGNLVDMRSAMSSVITLMNQMGVTAYEAVEGLKLMSEYDIRTASNFSAISDALNRFASAGKVAGMSMQEMIQVSTAFTEIGIKGARAGTALNTIIARISNTKKAREMLDSLGVSMTVVENGTIRAASSFERLVAAYKKVKESGNRSALQQFGYTMAGARMQSVLFAGLEQYIKQTRSNVSLSEVKSLADSLGTNLTNAFTKAPIVANPKINLSGRNVTLNANEVKQKLIDGVQPLMNEFIKEFEAKGSIALPSDLSLMKRLMGLGSYQEAADMIALYGDTFKTIKSLFENFFESVESNYDNVSRLALSTSDTMKKAREAALDEMRNTIQNQYTRAQNAFQESFLDTEAIKSYTEAVKFAVGMFGTLGDVIASIISPPTLNGFLDIATAVKSIGFVIELYLGSQLLNLLGNVEKIGMSVFTTIGSSAHNAFVNLIKDIGTVTANIGNLEGWVGRGPLENSKWVDKVLAVIGSSSDRISVWSRMLGEDDMSRFETAPTLIEKFNEAVMKTQASSNYFDELSDAIAVATSRMEGLILPSSQIVDKAAQAQEAATAASKAWGTYASSLTETATSLELFNSIYGSLSISKDDLPVGAMQKDFAESIQMAIEKEKEMERENSVLIQEQNKAVEGFRRMAEEAVNASEKMLQAAQNVNKIFQSPVKAGAIPNISAQVLSSSKNLLPSFVRSDLSLTEGNLFSDENGVSIKWLNSYLKGMSYESEELAKVQGMIKTAITEADAVNGSIINALKQRAQQLGAEYKANTRPLFGFETEEFEDALSLITRFKTEGASISEVSQYIDDIAERLRRMGKEADSNKLKSLFEDLNNGATNFESTLEKVESAIRSMLQNGSNIGTSTGKLTAAEELLATVDAGSRKKTIVTGSLKSAQEDKHIHSLAPDNDSARQLSDMLEHIIPMLKTWNDLKEKGQKINFADTKALAEVNEVANQLNTSLVQAEILAKNAEEAFSHMSRSSENYISAKANVENFKKRVEEIRGIVSEYNKSTKHEDLYQGDFDRFKSLSTSLQDMLAPSIVKVNSATKGMLENLARTDEESGQHIGRLATAYDELIKRANEYRAQLSFENKAKLGADSAEWQELVNGATLYRRLSKAASESMAEIDKAMSLEHASPDILARSLGLTKELEAALKSLPTYSKSASGTDFAVALRNATQIPKGAKEWNELEIASGQLGEALKFLGGVAESAKRSLTNAADGSEEKAKIEERITLLDQWIAKYEQLKNVADEASTKGITYSQHAEVTAGATAITNRINAKYEDLKPEQIALLKGISDGSGTMPKGAITIDAQINQQKEAIEGLALTLKKMNQEQREAAANKLPLPYTTDQLNTIRDGIKALHDLNRELRDLKTQAQETIKIGKIEVNGTGTFIQQRANLQRRGSDLTNTLGGSESVVNTDSMKNKTDETISKLVELQGKLANVGAAAKSMASNLGSDTVKSIDTLGISSENTSKQLETLLKNLQAVSGTSTVVKDTRNKAMADAQAFYSTMSPAADDLMSAGVKLATPSELQALKDSLAGLKSDAADLTKMTDKYRTAYYSIKGNPEAQQTLRNLNIETASLIKEVQALITAIEKIDVNSEKSTVEVKKLQDQLARFKEAKQHADGLASSLDALIGSKLGQAVRGTFGLLNTALSTIMSIYGWFMRIQMVANLVSGIIKQWNDYLAESATNAKKITEEFESQARLQNIIKADQEALKKLKDDQETSFGALRDSLVTIGSNRPLVQQLSRELGTTDSELLGAIDSYKGYLETYWQAAEKMAAEGKNIFEDSRYSFQTWSEYIGKRLGIEAEAMKKLEKLVEDYLLSTHNFDISKRTNETVDMLHEQINKTLELSKNTDNIKKQYSDTVDKVKKSFTDALKGIAEDVEHAMRITPFNEGNGTIVPQEEVEEEVRSKILSGLKAMDTGIDGKTAPAGFTSELQKTITEMYGKVDLYKASIDQIAGAFNSILEKAKDSPVLFDKAYQALEVFAKGAGQTVKYGEQIQTLLKQASEKAKTINENQKTLDMLKVSVDKADVSASTNTRLTNQRQGFAELDKREEELSKTKEEIDLLRAGGKNAEADKRAEQYIKELEDIIAKRQALFKEFEETVHEAELEIAKGYMNTLIDVGVEGKDRWDNLSDEFRSMLEDAAKIGLTPEEAQKYKEAFDKFEADKIEALNTYGDAMKEVLEAESKIAKNDELIKEQRAIQVSLTQGLNDTQAAEAIASDAYKATVKRISELEQDSATLQAGIKEKSDKASEDLQKALDNAHAGLQTAIDTLFKGVNEMGRKLITALMERYNIYIEAWNKKYPGFTQGKITLDESLLPKDVQFTKPTKSSTPKTPSKEEVNKTRSRLATVSPIAKAQAGEESEKVKSLEREIQNRNTEIDNLKKQLADAKKGVARSNKPSGSKKDPNKDALQELLANFSEEMDTLKIAYQTVQDEEGNIIKYLDQTNSYEYIEDQIATLRRQRAELAKFLNEKNLTPALKRKAEKELRKLDLQTVKLELDLDTKKFEQKKDKIKFEIEMLKKQLTLPVDFYPDKVKNRMLERRLDTLDKIWDIQSSIFKEEYEKTVKSNDALKIQQMEHERLNVILQHTADKLDVIKEKYDTLMKKSINISFGGLDRSSDFMKSLYAQDEDIRDKLFKDPFHIESMEKQEKALARMADKYTAATAAATKLMAEFMRVNPSYFGRSGGMNSLTRAYTSVLKEYKNSSAALLGASSMLNQELSGLYKEMEERKKELSSFKMKPEEMEKALDVLNDEFANKVDNMYIDAWNKVQEELKNRISQIKMPDVDHAMPIDLNAFANILGVRTPVERWVDKKAKDVIEHMKQAGLIGADDDIDEVAKRIKSELASSPEAKQLKKEGIKDSFGIILPTTQSSLVEYMKNVEIMVREFYTQKYEEILPQMVQAREAVKGEALSEKEMNDVKQLAEELAGEAATDAANQLNSWGQQQFERIRNIVIETLKESWEEGFDIGYEYGFSTEGWQQFTEMMKKKLAKTLSNALYTRFHEYIEQAVNSLTDAMTDGMRKALGNSKWSQDMSAFAQDIMAPMLSTFFGGLIGMAIGSLFTDYESEIQKQADEQLKQQRDQINAQGFSWSYGTDTSSTPYYEFSPPVTQESIKVIKFSSTFNITTDAALALASHRRELERVCAEIIEAYNRNAAKTVGASI